MPGKSYVGKGGAADSKHAITRNVEARLGAAPKGKKLDIYEWLCVPEEESNGIVYIRCTKESNALLLATIESIQLTQPDLWIKVYISTRSRQELIEYPRVSYEKFKRNVKWTELTNCILYDARNDLKNLQVKDPRWILVDSSSRFLENNWYAKIPSGKLTAPIIDSVYHTNFWSGDITILETLGLLEESMLDNRQGRTYLNRAAEAGILEPTSIRVVTPDYTGYVKEKMIDKAFARSTRKFIPFTKRKLR